MQIDPAAKQKIQIALALAIAVAAVRTGYVLYARYADRHKEVQQPSAPPLNPDYYVTPKKLYPYDLKSARALTKQPVWVKVGYAYSYYPYNSAAHRADLSKEAGQLLPLQKLEIKDVIAEAML